MLAKKKLPWPDMSERPKLLLLDDDPQVIELYQELLSRLASQPEIYTAASGIRALSILESGPFTLLLSDLKMAKMDGLQVLTIVRRKFPQLRTAAMTGAQDEHLRARAYAIGVDLFLEKPATSQEITFFLDCIESLLTREETAGFRGVQSKSLVDIVQLECLSQSSSTLRITHGVGDGKIWIHQGEVIDAATGDLTGEAAFQKMLSWKHGSFESLPPDLTRPRTILASYQGLLLETAQALDEARARKAARPDEAELPSESVKSDFPLADLAQIKGVEFIVAAPSNEKQKCKVWGAENPEQIANWSRQTLQRFRWLGETLQAGSLNHIQAQGAQRRLGLVMHDNTEWCVGFHCSLSSDLVRQNLKSIVAKWAS